MTIRVPPELLPTISTRKALLVLDLQNDFVRPSGRLSVPKILDFLDRIPTLVQSFRQTGDVVWIQSQFESPCPLIDPDSGRDRVVLAAGPLDSKRRSTAPSKRTRVSVRGRDTSEDQEDSDYEEEKVQVDPEAFLSGSDPACQPQTPGVQFPAPIVAAIDPDVDTIIVKSDYSALQSPGLVLSLRSRLVTELYMCGALSNISVYATALDAVRQGFAITLIEDCLGFRSFARHEEAMRRMADVLGASGISTQELLQEHEWEETEALACAGATSPPLSSNTTSADLEGDLDHLVARFSAEDHQDGDDEGAAANCDPVQNTTAPPRPADEPESSVARQPHHLSDHSSCSSNAGEPVANPPSAKTGTKSMRKPQPNSSAAIDGREDLIGEGDSRIHYDLELPPDAFERIRDEVRWQTMYHLSGPVPRLVAVQGEIHSDGTWPIYRHPADESPPLEPYTSTIQRVHVVVERLLGHPLNHILIQLYRDGQDRISEHADKTLDIVRGSFIANVSLGAQRTMVLRAKPSAVNAASPTSTTGGNDETPPNRPTQRIPMPHASLFVLGEQTNRRWLHGIRPDRRSDREKLSPERAFGGQRISLTFRHIGTFIKPGEPETIWGQGAVAKASDQARPVIHGEATETQRLVRAFGLENQDANFNWDTIYGKGFDVVNFETQSVATLVLSGDVISDLRVRLALAEAGLRYTAVHELPFRNHDATVVTQPVYLSPDGTTTVRGDVSILSYLATSPRGAMMRAKIDRLSGGKQLQKISNLTATWRQSQPNRGEAIIQALLSSWEQALYGQHYLEGPTLGIDDCAFWPLLREMVEETGEQILAKWPSLKTYYHRVGKRSCVRDLLDKMRTGS